MGRYIDADALHDALKAKQLWVVRCGDKHNEGYTYDQVHFAIDEAPTIEPTEEFEWCHDCKEYDQDKHCCHRWSKQIRETAAELEELYKPKRGEWIFKTVFPNDKSEFPMGYLVCSVCGSHHSNSTPCNYCDNCGADMREREGE